MPGTVGGWISRSPLWRLPTRVLLEEICIERATVWPIRGKSAWPLPPLISCQSWRSREGSCEYAALTSQRSPGESMNTRFGPGLMPCMTEAGTLSTRPPSTSTSPCWLIHGGRATGIEADIRIASQHRPLRRISRWLVLRLAATT